MLKRIVVYLLVICLLAGMAPVTALASEAELPEEELILPEDSAALPEAEAVPAEEEILPAAPSEADAESKLPAVTEEYTAMAAGTDVPWLTWTVSDGAVTITGGTGSLPAQLEIPAEIDGLPVTAIAEGAFAFSSALESVSIPASVTSIGERAFARCTGITAFLVDDANPAYETDDDGFVFTRQNVALVLAPGAFRGAYTVPEDVTDIRAEVFAGCGVAEIALPEGLLTIGENAFSGSGLGSVTIPASVTYIGPGAFGMCSGLTQISVAAGNAAYTSAGGALYDAGMTTLIQAPGGYSGTFEIPAGVTAVGAWAFAAARGLADVVLPESLVSVGESAFYLCSALTSVRIPAGCTSLGAKVFEDCTALVEIHFAHGADDGLAIGTNAFLLNSGALNTLVYVADTAALPAAVENYPWAAGGRNVTFLREGETPPEDPTGLTWTISDGAVTVTGFTDELEADVRIPARIEGLPVTAIAEAAFSGCSRIETLTLPESLLTIGATAFYRSTLTSVTIPASVTAVGEAAFGQCRELKTISVAAGNTAYAAENGVLYNIDKTILLQAPGGLGGICRIPDSVTAVADWAFSLCTSLRGVTLPAGLTSIGEYAFSYCYGLTSVRIPAEVASIGRSAFENCSALTDIAFEHPVTAALTIGADAFLAAPEGGAPLATAVYVPDKVHPHSAVSGYAWAASNRTVIYDDLDNAGFSGVIDGMVYRYSAVLGSVEITGYTEELRADTVIPGTIEGWPVRSIGEDAFAECLILERVSVPEGVVSLETNAFTKCKNLVSVSLPGSLRSIGDGAFSEDNDLCEINFPEGLVSIGRGAFAWVWGLTEIDLPASVSFLDEETFLDCRNAGIIRFAHTAADELTIGTLAFNILNADLVRTIVAVPDVSAVHPAVTAYPWEESRRQVRFTDTIPDAFSGEENGFSYTYDAFTEGVTVTAVAGGPFESVVIPDTLGGWPVTGLGNDLFRGWQELRNVTLPMGLRTIGDGAFRMCEALANIDLPGSVEWIGDWAFADCAALRSAALPAALRHLGSAAFMYCAALENVKLPAGLTRLDGDTFRGCSSLRTLVIPEGPTYIGGRAFRDSGIGAVLIPASVTRIDEEAFLNCASLVSVGFSHSAGAELWIAPDAFTADTETGMVRTHVYAADGKKLPEALFSYAWGTNGRLMDAHPLDWWEDAASAVGLQYSFRNGEVSVDGCTPNIPAEIYIPAAVGGCPVTSVEPDALAWADALRSIRVDSANAAYCDVDGVLFTRDRSTLVRYPAGRENDSCAVPVGTVAVGDYAFFRCAKLTSVTLPGGLAVIGDSAFAWSRQLKGPLTIPASVRLVGAEAFLDCLALDVLHFEHTAADQLTVEAGAFDLRSADRTLPTVIYVPDAQDVHPALAECPWERAMRSVRFVNDDQMENSGVYQGIRYTYDWFTGGLRLTACEILPEGVLTIPGEIDGYPVTVLGEGLFRNAAALTEVVLPESLRSVETYAFYGCEALVRADLPSGVTALGQGAFENCRSLRSMALPAGLKTVEEHTFEHCEALESVLLPYGLTEIKSSAFAWCTALRSIVFPASAAFVDGFAFCNQLTDICFMHRAEDPLTLERQAFAYYTSPDAVLETTVRMSDPAHPHAALQSFNWSDNFRSVTYLGGDESALTWIVSGAEVTVTGLTDPETKQLLIPGTIEGLPVTAIAPEAFLCAPLETVTLPDGLTTIGAGAFLGCDKLRSVTLPATVTELQDIAFSGCLALTEIRFLHEADADLTIAAWAFALDGGIDITDTTVYVPDRWEIHPAVSGHDWAFNRRNVAFRSLFVEDAESSTVGLVWKMTEHGLTITGYTAELPDRVVIPSEIDGVPVTAIGESAFMNCKQLRSIRIPDSVTWIGIWAFSSCSSLETAVLPSGLTTIPYACFTDCKRLRSVVLPDSLAVIEGVAFGGCWGLREITFSAGVTEIGERAFSDCHDMKTIRFLHTASDELAIGQWAFEIANYGDVDTLICVPDINAIHPSISGYAWETPNPEYSFEYRRHVTYTAENTAGLLWREENGEIVITGYTDELPGWVIVPAAIDGKPVAAIAVGAFERCGAIRRLTLPGSVKTVGDQAFKSCGDLRSVELGKGLLELGAQAFSGCIRLSAVPLPDSLRTIGEGAFERCSALTDVTVPASVETVGSGAFEDCAALTGLSFRHTAADPLALAPGAFLCEAMTDTTVRVPDAAKVHPALSGYDWAADRRNVTFMAAAKAAQAAGLLWEVRGGTVTITGYTAWLPAALTIPAEIEGYRVTAIGDSAFDSCEKIKSVVIPEGVLTIGTQAFQMCANLRTVSLPNSLTAVGEGAFAWCHGLTAVDLPASVGALGPSAFYDCTELTEIRFRHERTDALTIGARAFGLLNAEGPLATTVSVADTDRIHPSVGRYDWVGRLDEGEQSRIVTYTSVKDAVVAGSSVTMTGAAAVYGGVAVTWQKAEYAESYEIFRKAGSAKKWTSMEIVSGTSWLDTNVKNNTKYAYTVRALRGTIQGGYDSKGKTVTYYAAPALAAPQNTAAGEKLSWGKVGGASKYQVSRLEDDGTLTPVGVTTKTNLTDTGVISGDEYTYTVQCLNKKGKPISGYDPDGVTGLFVAAPALPVLTVTEDGIALAWDAPENADAYVICRKAGSAKTWTAVGTVEGTEWLDTDVKNNTKYTYTIQAVWNGVASGYNTTGKSVKFYMPPVITELSATVSGVKVKWGKVGGASKYRLFRIEDDGTLTKIGDTKKLTLTDKTAPSGTVCTYTLQCLNKKGAVLSDCDSEGVGMYYLAAPALPTLTNEADAVLVSWEAVGGAETYTVFRKAGKETVWTAAAEGIPDPSFRDTDVSSGVKYTYRIQAVSGETLSPMQSKGRAVVFLTPPELTGAAAVSSGIKVTWQKVPGAKGYYVYRRTEGGDWAKIGTIKKGGTVSYTDKKAAAGTMYFYTVAAYNGKSVSDRDPAGVAASRD